MSKVVPSVLALTVLLACVCATAQPLLAEETLFEFRVTSGNSGFSGPGGSGSQGPAGNDVLFTIDSLTGQASFQDYVHVTYSAGTVPAVLLGTTVRLKNDTGTYNFSSGQFDGLQFDVEIENSGGAVTVTTHSFRGSTSTILPVPVEGCPPGGTTMNVRLTDFMSLDLGNGYSGNVEFNAEFVSSLDLTAGATFLVNAADDVDDGSCDSVHCSLREAMLAANTNPGSDTIAFDIAPSGTHTIAPLSNLPRITDSVLIDGTTQPGFVSSPIIELDGSGATAHGLRIQADGCTIRGLVINRFPAHGIRVESGTTRHTSSPATSRMGSRSLVQRYPALLCWATGSGPTPPARRISETAATESR